MTMMRVTPTVAMDWLVRELLPGLLVVAAGRFGSDESPFRVTARTLSERAPLASAGDRYDISRLVATLTELKTALAAALLVERRCARGRVGLVDSFGGPGRFRSVFFPEFDEITGLVARALTMRGVGELARSCAIGAIAVAAARADASTAVASTASPRAVQPLVEVYETALRQLARRCGVPVAPVGDDRFQVLLTRRANKSRGFRGVFHGPAGPVACPHAHQTIPAARRCAQLLARHEEVAA